MHGYLVGRAAGLACFIQKDDALHGFLPGFCEGWGQG
jgi:hypothetical protein